MPSTHPLAIARYRHEITSTIKVLGSAPLAGSISSLFAPMSHVVNVLDMPLGNNSPIREHPVMLRGQVAHTASRYMCHPNICVWVSNFEIKSATGSQDLSSMQNSPNRDFSHSHLRLLRAISWPIYDCFSLKIPVEWFGQHYSGHWDWRDTAVEA